MNKWYLWANNWDVGDDEFWFDEEYTVNGMTIAIRNSMYVFTGLVELIGLRASPSETALIYSSPYLSVSQKSIFVFKERYLITLYLC